ncbi:hypothetical protein [Kineococcus radiotolerans]|uniref:hypothetical protein n=1 Tax=Kineococcus radiotolerans TaxID=131568 RepID=UPI00003A3E0E|nr:hypothetical protein [Kineococcus radiotolerans]
MTFCELRIREALSADVRDYSHDHGHDHDHRVLKIDRKGGKAARVLLPPTVVRALDEYLGKCTTGLLLMAAAGGYSPNIDVDQQLDRLHQTAVNIYGGHVG